MAHAAKIVDGVVTQVIVVSNEVLTNDGEFSSRNEALLNEYLQDIGLDGTWKLTSYNRNFRGTYAGVGMAYGQSPGGSAGEYEFFYPAEAMNTNINTADIETEEE